MHALTTMDIYKASAGSGKTFSLTLQYLEQALKEPNHYRRILAVTFTNKATAEMKERVLHVLQGLATNSNSIEQYRTQLLKKMPQFTSSLLQQKAAAAYTAILHDYSRFSVTTIDSFVQRIIRSFAWELGIDGGFKLQLSTDPVKQDLAERLYMRLDDDIDLQHWVIEMARKRLEQGQRWEFKTDMMTLASELFKEKFSDFEASFGNQSEAEIHQHFLHLNKQVSTTINDIKKKWEQKGQEIISLLQQHHLQKEDFHYSNKGFINYFFKAAQQEIVKPGQRILDAIATPEKMAATKTSAANKAAIASITDKLLAALNQLVNWYNSEIEEFETAQAIKKNVEVLRLMRVFAMELAAYRKENNTLLISDTHHLLKELTKDTTASFIYEKTGNRYQHYLIDEFQDTSGFQWDNFLPLLKESLANGQYNLLVGDVKQAIYRWRNGDWRLLLHQAEQQLSDFKPVLKSLQENYRSAKAIIQFNNLLFHVAPQLLQLELSASIANASTHTQQVLRNIGYDDVFNKAYADSYQQMPAGAKENGVVNIQFVQGTDDTDESIDYEETALQQLYLKIQTLFAEGFTAKDMAVLTRTNSEAKAVVEWLIAAQEANHFHFQVISGDALLLSSNQVIQMIICALRWVNDDRNKLALAQLRQLILLQQNTNPNTLSVFAANGSNDMLPPMFIQGIHWLRTLPLTELLHQLVMMFGWNDIERHQSYLLAFYDKVQEWNRYGDASLQEFLNYWDEEGIKSSLPATPGADAIEVVTVHKSKGLDYNIVLMPFLDWNIVPKGGPLAPIIWADNSQSPFNSITVVPVKYSSALANSFFAADYYEEFLLAAMDNLNVLYVAFTRARQRLYGWAPFTKKSTSKEDDESFAYKNIGALLQAVASSTIQLPTDKYEDTRLAYDATNFQWFFGQPAPNTTTSISSGSPLRHQYVYTNWLHRMKVKFQAIHNEEEDEIVLPRNQGILLHEILSRLAQPAQLNTLLQTLQQEGWMDDRQARKIKEILLQLLSMEAIKPWHSNTYKRLAERNIINSERQLRRPDLVLYNDNETIVYDFKFTTNDIDIEQHKRQVAEYMTMLQQMKFAPVKGWVIYGLDKKAVAVL